MSFLIEQASGIAALFFMFNAIHSIEGWELNELLLLYGIFQIPRGIDHLFADRIWNIPRMVVKGELDKYLIKPVSPLFLITFDKFEISALGEIVVGVGLLLMTIPNLVIEWTIAKVVIFLFMILASTLIYTCIKIAGASISLFVQNSFVMLQTMYNLSSFGKYPTSVYPKLLRYVSTYLIPFAFTAYYPTAYILNKDGVTASSAVSGLLFALLFIGAIAAFLWNYGIRRYESAGS